MKKSIMASGKNYFKSAACPLAVQSVGAGIPGHEYDLTEVEHYHDFSELVVVASGTGIQVIDEQEYPVEAGDVFLLNGFTEHYFKQRDNLVIHNLQFDAEHLPLPELFLRKLPGFNIFFLLEPNLRSARGFRKMLHVEPLFCRELIEELQRLKQELTGRKPGFEAVSFAQFLSIITKLAQQYPADSEASSSPALARMGKIISTMEESFTRAWTLDELAERTCMSPNNFMRLFKQATGMSPIAYLIRLRLRSAAALLRKTQAPISEISERVGFSDSNYFCKQFQNHFHTTPRQYRQQPAP